MMRNLMPSLSLSHLIVEMLLFLGCNCGWNEWFDPILRLFIAGTCIQMPQGAFVT